MMKLLILTSSEQLET